MFKNEYDIIKAEQSGDNTAKEQLFENYNKLIIMIANKAKRYAEDFEELYQCGCIGFMKALNRFDVKKGYKFTTYVYPLVKGEMQIYYRELNETVKHKRSNRYKYTSILKLETQGKKEKEICSILEMKYEEFEKIVFEFSSSYILSLNAANRHCDDGKIFYIDMLADVKNEFEGISNKIVLENVIGNLKEFDKKVLCKYYFKEKTQVEIAAELGASQVQISRSLKRSLKELKKMLTKDGVENVQ